MSETAFVNDAKVMAKGQVTIPKNVRAALGIETGDRVTFILTSRVYYTRTLYGLDKRRLG